MKKTISVLLAMLLIALTLTPALAAGETYQVTFVAPSAEAGEGALAGRVELAGRVTLLGLALPLLTELTERLGALLP